MPQNQHGLTVIERKLSSQNLCAVQIITHHVLELSLIHISYDETKNYTPINDAKIKYAKWSLLRVCLHNAVTPVSYTHLQC